MARSATTFQRGHTGMGGRPKGRRNKATVEVREAARHLVEDETYRKNLLTRLRNGTAGPMELVLWAYAYGRPPQRLEHAGEIGAAGDLIGAIRAWWDARHGVSPGENGRPALPPAEDNE